MRIKTQSFKAGVLVLAAGAFVLLVSVGSAEELKKLQAPVKGSLAINPVIKQAAPVQSTAAVTISPAKNIAVQVPTISGPAYQKNVADIFKSAGGPIPTGLGDTGAMDPSLRRAANLEMVDGVWVTRTAPAKVPGSDSTLPKLGGGSIDQSEVVIKSGAPVIPDEDTIPIGSPKFSANVPMDASEDTITPAAGIVARIPADGETAPSGGGLGSRKRAAAQRLLADAATTEPRTITVSESPASGGEAPEEGEGSSDSGSEGDSLEDRVMSLLEELPKDKQEAVQGKDTTKNGESKNAESS